MNDSPDVWPRWLLSVVCVLACLWLIEDGLDPATAAVDRQAHLGIWTDEKGTPGNRICFWDYNATPSSAVGRYHGLVRFRNFLGYESVDGVYNFGHWHPVVVLNVVIRDVTYCASVQSLGPNRLMVRFTRDPEEYQIPPRPGDPKTVVLTRVPNEPWPPIEPSELQVEY